MHNLDIANNIGIYMDKVMIGLANVAGGWPTHRTVAGGVFTCPYRPVDPELGLFFQCLRMCPRISEDAQFIHVHSTACLNFRKEMVSVPSDLCFQFVFLSPAKSLFRLLESLDPCIDHEFPIPNLHPSLLALSTF